MVQDVYKRQMVPSACCTVEITPEVPLAPGPTSVSYTHLDVYKRQGFKRQETLCMVFLWGLINIIITVTKIRKMIIQAIPEVLQNAIGGGIGLFLSLIHI